MPEAFDHRNCPFANRCSKYAELTLRNDRKDERIRQVLAENARLKARVAELEVDCPLCDMNAAKARFNFTDEAVEQLLASSVAAAPTPSPESSPPT